MNRTPKDSPSICFRGNSNTMLVNYPEAELIKLWRVAVYVLWYATAILQQPQLLKLERKGGFKPLQRAALV
jgi:hypothetical protein